MILIWLAISTTSTSIRRSMGSYNASSIGRIRVSTNMFAMGILRSIGRARQLTLGRVANEFPEHTLGTLRLTSFAVESAHPTTRLCGGLVVGTLRFAHPTKEYGEAM